MLFLDLSEHNVVDSWASLAAGKVGTARLRGVILRASYGADGRDKRYQAFRTKARSLGLAVGSYHYAYPAGGDAEAEAENFVRTVGRLGPDDLRPALDVEEVVGTFPWGDADAWSRAWNRVAWAGVGACPMFYSAPVYIGRIRPARPIGCGLWLASWGPNDGSRHPPAIPAPWRKCVLHQFTSVGSWPGVRGRVDMNWAPRIAPLLAFPR